MSTGKKAKLPRCNHSGCSFNSNGSCSDYLHPSWDTCHEKDGLPKKSTLVQSSGPSIEQIAAAHREHQRLTSGYDPAGEESSKF